ncbi:MAG: cellulase family glycosylhydrolase [Acidimicrobiales bacterium]|nr:cellulase family glycosylhydrolase [Acidimicrobiales bacterium]
MPSGFNLSAGTHDDNAFFEASAAEDMFAADVERMIANWNVNTIRININSSVNPNIWIDGELDRVIGLLTDHGIVAMIENHPYGTGLDPTAGQIQTTVNGFRTLARRWKNNPCVWFNPYNEPGGKLNVSTYHVNSASVTNDDAWVDWHTPVIDAIRAESNAVVVLDDTHFGQGRAGNNYNPDHSAILAYGERLNVAYDNLLYSIHFYDRWGGNSADMRSFIDAAHAKGLTLVVGETGGHPTEGPWYTQNYWPTSQALYAMAPRGVGILLWHANVRYTSGMSVGINFGQRVPVWDVTERSQTEASGRLHWDWAHNLPSARP